MAKRGKGRFSNFNYEILNKYGGLIFHAAYRRYSARLILYLFGSRVFTIER